jgi:uncharacterized protein
VSETLTRVPIVDGWFTNDVDHPTLLGSQCPLCSTYVFPPRDGYCPNPGCDSPTLVSVPLSRFGRVWSYTENQYAPPPPYVAADPFEPYALAAVQLEKEGLIVLGRVPKGVMAADLKVGMLMQLELDISHSDETNEYTVYVWAPATESLS